MYWLCQPTQTHCLQPLDDVPFANFKGSWYEGVWQYVRSSGGQKALQSRVLQCVLSCMGKGHNCESNQSRVQEYRGMAS